MATPSIQDATDRGYVDWAAIFAGAVVATGVAVVFTTFAAALGLGSVSVGEDGGISFWWLIITALFVVISMVAANALGGYVAGRMRRPVGSATKDEVTVRDGFNGLAVWGVGMIVSAVIAASVISGGLKTAGNVAQTAAEVTGSAVGGIAQGAGQLAGGVVSGAGQAVGGLAQGAGQAAGPALDDMLPQGMQSNPLDYITDRLLRADGQNPASTFQQDAEANMSDTQRQIAGIFANVIRTGEISDSDRAFLRDQVGARTGMNPQEVDARVNEAVEQTNQIRAEAQQKVDEAKAELERLRTEAQQRLDEAKQQAIDAAEQARVTGILSAFLLAASALIAAAAAYIGAVRGGRDRDEGRVWGGLSYRR
ncbi:hypothetical protein [Paracoccus shanxieyensis]|uniref:ATP synthase F0 subunit B n=1 Tax=Paracoccus shanxieyensis TaxID=2675752 RepID=A0A6L6IYJ9_9RHOB|nr:hypothetical protein [Paracoccus shanxieyensis]MTH63654.1 hypothetical protein [Paracoccus shanxieyensis]MTH86835.1 hypothetical protein [Paracoccus shanxieyensis]